VKFAAKAVEKQERAVVIIATVNSRRLEQKAERTPQIRATKIPGR